MSDTYTTSIDPERAAAIPAMQRAARDEHQYLDGMRPLGAMYAKAVDDILSWLDGEQDDNIIESVRIRNAAAAAMGADEPGHSEREIRKARGDIGWEG